MGKFNREELKFIEALISFNQWKTCVEIGVAYGVGSVFIGRVAEKNGGHLYGFDAWSPYGFENQICQKGSKKLVINRLKKAGLTQFTLTQVDFVKERDRFKKELDKLCPEGIDFAFIDGDHSYFSVKNDFSIIYPRLTEFGGIIFHDTFFVDGCREFILDLRTKYNDGSFDIIDFPFGYGKTRCGVSLLMKRTYPISSRGIVSQQGSLSTPQEIELKELAWYISEIVSNKDGMKHLEDEVNISPSRIKITRNRRRFDD